MDQKVREKNTETSKRMLTKFVSIGSYSPEVRTLGTLITSTKVFSLIIICKVFDKAILYLEILDYVPRDLTILYLGIVDSKHKQVGGCLQKLCQSAAIHLKYVLLVLYQSV